uniref:ATP-dependent DNA helicase n=1 Tax=Chenopodium quinoa TaxID=63459 RepID=A0A803L9N6_CHEQI
MRAINDLPFCNFVLQIGNGTPPYEDGKNIELPKPLVIPYDNEQSSLHLLQGCTDDSSEQYPTEFLNNLCPSGLPPHHLTLKVGSPIILLRNIDLTLGLCNGTRLVCKAFFPNVIDAEIIDGHRCGERVFIPRIPLQPSATDKYPFRFTRKQFPINLSFAMTINKSQGQKLDRVGIYLPQPFFSHGQLYVALSRAKKSKHVQILIKPTTDELDGWKRTKNVVQIIVQNNIMATQRLTLARLTYHNINFTFTAKLIKKNPPKKSRSDTTNLQQLIFEDAENTQMKAMIFERDTELFRNLLLEGKEYNITNSIITRTPEMFTGEQHLYQMTIKSATRVCETQQHFEPCSYFVPLNQVLDLVGRSDRIDIIGISIHIHDTETIRSKKSGLPNDVRRIEIIDSNMKRIKLSMWNSLVTHEAVADIVDTMPVIEVSRVKASTFDEGSFNTTFASTVKINPSNLEAQLLRDWKLEQDVETVIRVLQPGPVGIVEHKFTDKEIHDANAMVINAVKNWQRRALLEKSGVLKDYVEF